MISSKYVTAIGIVLVLAAVVLTMLTMISGRGSFSANFTGDVSYSELHTVSYSEDDYYNGFANNAVTEIKLNGSNIISGSRNVTVEGKTVIINSGGVYIISGVLNDGNIVVDSKDDAEVKLIFNGASVSCSDYSALHIKQAEKTIISLAEGTENYLYDGDSYTLEPSSDISAKAALHSEDSLTINGKGTLEVCGSFGDGIKVDDVFKVIGADITVVSADDGINVNDYILFSDADVNITSVGDAVKCEHEDMGKGFIAFENICLSVKSDADGVYSSSAVYVNGGEYNIVTGGGSSDVQLSRGGFGGRDEFGRNASNTDTPSTKAFKTAENLVINSGAFNLDSYDDALHSDSDIAVNGGVFTISSGNDAVHADGSLLLKPEKMDITKSLEGVEGGYITIDGGDITVVSSDDGINATGIGNTGFGMPMMGSEDFSDEKIYLRINGGNIIIETGGDGVDSNGSAVITDGNVRVYGPENNGNASLDFQNGLRIDGGSLLSAGSSGMAELPSEQSAQNCAVFYLDSTYGASSEISLADSDGNIIISDLSSKRFNWVCISSDKLVTGEVYTLIINGENVFDIEISSRVSSSGAKGGRVKW